MIGLHPGTIDFNVSQVVDSVTALLGQHAREKAITLTADIAPDLPEWIAGDSMCLRQVLLDLVASAIKSTEAGQVTIAVTNAARPNGTIELSFAVRSTDIGIAPLVATSPIPHFCQAPPFCQVRAATAPQYDETVAGPAILRQLIERMGGRIEVACKPGRGSTFTFAVVMRLGQPVQCRVKESEPETIGGPARPHVLAVDDNHVNRKLIAAMLSRIDCTIDLAANGREAVEAVKRGSYDIVLMDVEMPEMDGPAATRAIRALGGAFAHLPIVALTANAMLGQREEYLAAGMNDYVSKPINTTRLIAAMARALGRKVANTSAKIMRMPARPATALPINNNAASVGFDALLGQIADTLRDPGLALAAGAKGM